MIIWINGPFGAGKTTLAKRLRDRRSKSLIFDPEEIGFVVKETVPMPASGDYQDLPLWRGLGAQLHAGGQGPPAICAAKRPPPAFLPRPAAEGRGDSLRRAARGRRR